MYAREVQILESVVEKLRAVHELQVELSISSLTLQEFESPLEHGVPGGFRRQGHIQAAVSETPLQFQMRKRAASVLPSPMGASTNRMAGPFKSGQSIGNSLL